MTGRLESGNTGSMPPDARQSFSKSIQHEGKLIDTNGKVSIFQRAKQIFAIFHREDRADDIVELEPGPKK